MNVSVSNIAWSGAYDKEMYKFLQEIGCTALEIAPTRIFPDNPYLKLDEAAAFAASLKNEYGLHISSMQSIWYGRTENIFGSSEERKALIDYTKSAIDFAVSLGCKNAVFGCPKNRIIQDESQYATAVAFFREIGQYALKNNTVIAMEPNPTIYNTNFINTTAQAFELVKAVDSLGMMVNIDLGTMIYNGETLLQVADHIQLVNHIHISEPYLAKIEVREMHKELKQLLYDRFFSIEMKDFDDIEQLKKTVTYVMGVLR